MTKKCRNCKHPKQIKFFPKMNMGKFGVGSTCFDCMNSKMQSDSYEIKRTPLKRSQKPINAVSKTNKNTPAVFTQKTKDEILARDKVCIISGNQISKGGYHHAFYGPHYANYGKDRNKADQGVGLSSEIHRIIHHPSPKEAHLSKIYRAKCIIYLKKYYAL